MAIKESISRQAFLLCLTTLCLAGGSCLNTFQLAKPATNLSLSVAPTVVWIRVGASQQLTATVVARSGNTLDVTSQATWRVSDPNIASISQGGLVVGKAFGVAAVTAVYQDITEVDVQLSASAPVIVVDSHDLLTSISVTAPASQPLLDSSGAYTAKAVYANGHQLDVTPAAKWSTSNPNVIVIDPNGVATPVAVGSATITAGFGGLMSSPVNVSVSSVVATLADFSSGVNSLASGWGSWTSFQGGALSNGTHAVIYSAPGYADSALQMTYTLDSGSYGFAHVTAENDHEISLNSLGIDKISFYLRGSGTANVNVQVATKLSNPSNNYGVYGYSVGMAPSNWTAYTIPLSSLVWLGDPTKQNYFLQDALNHNTGFRWQADSSPGGSGSILLDNISIVQDSKKNPRVWTQIWADEFNQAGPPNPNVWGYDLGDGCPTNCGWGNNENEWYTSRTDNVDGDGSNLVINALNDNYQGHAYTSGRITSSSKLDFGYGRIEARIKVPGNAGTWPTFWMMPTESFYGTWPASGEFDIMEHFSFDNIDNHSSAHMQNHNPRDGNQITVPQSLVNPNTSFHVYTMDWEVNRITMYVDGFSVLVYNNPGIGFASWPYDRRFYININVAVGGVGGGTPGTIWPAQMLVDYVRAYQ